MSDLLTAISGWKTLVVALIVFGFAPGAFLRMIVRVYPKSSPRRAELLAELPMVPRWERPFWVAEKLELALAEGIAQRLHHEPSRRALKLLGLEGVGLVSAGSASWLAGFFTASWLVSAVTGVTVVAIATARRARGWWDNADGWPEFVATGLVFGGSAGGGSAVGVTLGITHFSVLAMATLVPTLLLGGVAAGLLSGLYYLYLTTTLAGCDCLLKIRRQMRRYGAGRHRSGRNVAL